MGVGKFDGLAVGLRLGGAGVKLGEGVKLKLAVGLGVKLGVLVLGGRGLGLAVGLGVKVAEGVQVSKVMRVGTWAASKSPSSWQAMRTSKSKARIITDVVLPMIPPFCLGLAIAFLRLLQ